VYHKDAIATLEIPTIKCISSATGYWSWGGQGGYKDLIICKWVLDGVDYFDSSSTANKSCKKIGYSELFTADHENILKFENKETIITYIVSSLCAMNER
jgi:hypothetical protein